MLFRNFFLAGLVLFFAAQQALCACAPLEAESRANMAAPMAHEMPAGHACDEVTTPDKHDESTCPHCGTDTQLTLTAAQAVPASVALPVQVIFQPLAAEAPLVETPERIARVRYRAHGPPGRTPFQLKTRFLN